ncbi:MAG: type II secretion system F family protein, partial [Clostridia bacterium]|nr:type II secretion system F family protein [Clostridia bacterium]
MPEFKYRAVLRNGKMVRGIFTAQSKSDVIQMLKNTKMTPISIVTKRIKRPAVKRKEIDLKKLSKAAERDTKKSTICKVSENKNMTRKQKLMALLTSDVSISKRVKPKDVLVFTNALYILKKAKFNNITALESVYNSTVNKRLKDIIEEIIIAVESGETIYSVMLRYPNVFPPLYANFVKVGEESGSLDNALMYGRQYMESSIRLRKTIRGILLPKIAMFVFVLAAMMIALLFGAPLIENVYEMFDVDKELPVATQVAITASKWLVVHWYFIVGAIVGLFLLYKIYTANPIGRYNVDKLKIKMPVFGTLILNITTNKFFQAMALNMRNGMRIQDSLEISKSVTDNYYFLALIETGKNNLLSGGSWIEPFEREGAFSPMTLEMLEIGIPALRLISICFVPASFGIMCSTMFQATGHGTMSLF